MSGVGFDDDPATAAQSSTVETTPASSLPSEFDVSAAVLSTEEWVHALFYWQFNVLTPDQVPYLTTAQVASIPNASYLGQISPASRAAFSATQIRALSIGNVGVSQLSSGQLDFLTATQIQQVKFYEFQLLKPVQIPYLTPEQIASIPAPGSLTAWSQTARNALTVAQINALDISKVGLEALTSAQVPFLTASQVQQVRFYEFDRLTPAQIPLLTAGQIASIPTAGSMSAWSQEARNALTVSQIQSLNIANVGLEMLSDVQVSFLTPAQVQQVRFYEFHRLSGLQTPLLTGPQIASIPTAGSMSAWSPAARSALTAGQIVSLNIANVGLEMLSDVQVSFLAPAQVQQVKFYEFYRLGLLQTPLLTGAQLASISTIGSFAAWSPAARGALNGAQVKFLNVGVIGIAYLTGSQVAALATVQIQQVKFYEFNLLSPLQIPSLTTTQIASIPTAGSMSAWSQEARNALTVSQIQSLNIANVGLEMLSDVQVSFLTPAQVQQVRFYEFHRLSGLQTPLLTGPQIASIPTAGSMSAWSPAARSALTAGQIVSLNIANVGLEMLSDVQVSFLAPAQVQQVKFYEFYRLGLLQTPLLTGAQLASISTIGSFAAWSPAARGALNGAQVKFLNVGVIGIAYLTGSQVAALATVQIQQVKFYEFNLLSPLQIPSLTTTQIASIPTAGSFAAWSAIARASLNAAQVRAINVGNVGLGLLTQTQLSFLTATQIQQAKYFDFALLSPAQTPLLTPAQMATIPTTGALAAWTQAARDALTVTQIRALDISRVGLESLTTAQVGFLTAGQIQQVKQYEFVRLSAGQVPALTLEQVASIPEAAALANWSADARAALTFDQVRSINIGESGRIAFFTPVQITWLTIAQIRAVMYYDLQYVNPSQAGYLTTAQMASIPTASYLAAWPKELLAALTAPLVRALKVSAVRIESLPAEQIGFLSVAQIQSVGFVDFEYLLPAQIPYLTAAQLQSMPSGGVLLHLSDASQAALTREQILSLPLSQLAQFTRVELDQYPPANYTPVVDRRGMDGSAHAQEEKKFYDLAPLASATNVTIASGAWSDPKIWRNGQAPAAGADAVISAGTTVIFDSVMNQAIETLRIDGTLTFATNRNTQLYADSVIVFTTGRLLIGSETSPIQDNVTARILIADGGPIDRAWDPYGVSRGLMSGGEVKMYGKQVTTYVPLAVDPAAGDTVLRLSSAPTKWKVGDRLVISGVNPFTTDFGSEEVTIRAISGASVTVDKLKYAHNAPDGYGLSIYVANMTRNIVFEAENPDVVAERPHMVFFSSPKVHVENIAISGFGRTDKSQPINDPIVVNGVLQPGTGTNPRARYAMHFHHTGVDPLVDPAYVSGSVVTDSAGWGFVNHQSNVIFDENVAYNVKGSSFVTEDGNEIGAFSRNLALNSIGASWESMHLRRASHDFGFNGHGFWMQGPGVELIGNISAGSRAAAFVYFTASAKAQFDAVNLNDPALAAGLKVTPVGVVPLNGFSDNVAVASQTGLEMWFHQMMMTDGDSVIERFTSWNSTLAGIALHYSGNVQIANAKLIGDLSAFNGIGIATNSFVHDVTINNLMAVGYQVGVDVPVRRSTVVNGAMIAAVQGFQIEKGYDTIRDVLILGQIAVSNPTALQLRGRTHWKVYLYENFDFARSVERQSDSYTSADQIVWAPYGIAYQELYFQEQASWFIPFPAATAAGRVPDGYLNKNNFQLWGDYGIAYNGQILPVNAVAVAGIRGYVGPLTP
ncbi:G8 domain-containing protein [Lacipirellula limnantheis]|nr:G8 domain-containing protein [Lacipirellula limnantheis]